MSFLATWLPFGHVRASASARAAALASARLEALTSPEGAATLISAGKQTSGALPVKTRALEGALYSSRGRGYARYNEDAAGLFADERGKMYAFALDQAGGLGGKIRGLASAIAAAKLWQAARTIATTADPSPSTITREILLAFESAHRTLLSRGEGEVTTAVMAVVAPDHAMLVNSGDSGALHFSKRGEPKGATVPQEFDGANQGCLKHAIGLEPEGSAPETYRWTLAPGDWLVLASDGLLDAGLDDKEVGALLVESTGAEDAVNRIATTVLRRMGTFRAKPDNLTLIALRVTGG